jgi:hypothetical protein
VEIRKIEMLNGSLEFCQEFLTDVTVDDGYRVGDVDGGWTIMTRWLHHERTVAGGSPYVTTAGSGNAGQPHEAPKLAALARSVGNLNEPGTLERIGEARALALVGEAFVRSVSRKMADGTLPHHAAANGWGHRRDVPQRHQRAPPRMRRDNRADDGPFRDVPGGPSPT